MVNLHTVEFDKLPDRIRRNLDPTEKPRISRRFHWAMLLKPVAVVVGGLFVWIALDLALPTTSRRAHLITWGLYAVWAIWTGDAIFGLRKAQTMLSKNRNYLFVVLAVAAGLLYLVSRADRAKTHSISAGGITALVLLGVSLWAFSEIMQWFERFFVLTNKRIVVIEGIFTTTVRSMPVSRLTDMAYRRTALGRTLGYGLLDVESAGQQQALKLIEFVPDPEYVNLQITNLLFGSSAPDPKNIALGGTVHPNGSISIQGQMDG